MFLAGYMPFPEFDVVTVVIPVGDGDPALLEHAETVAMTNAAPGRVREFAAGRQAARQALARLGIKAVSIGRSPDCSPCWPHGIIGSISHSRDLAGAVVTKDVRLAGIGFDMEQQVIGNPDDLAPLLTTPDELERLRFDCGTSLGAHLAMVASCKEAVFKAVYPAFGEYFDFPDIEIDFDTTLRAFAARPAKPLRSAGWVMVGRGRCMAVAGQVVSMFVVECEGFRHRSDATKMFRTGSAPKPRPINLPVRPGGVDGRVFSDLRPIGYGKDN